MKRRKEGKKPRTPIKTLGETRAACVRAKIRKMARSSFAEHFFLLGSYSSLYKKFIFLNSSKPKNIIYI